MNDKLRKEREREFHNKRFGAEHDIRQPSSKWYGALAAGTHAQDELVRHYGSGAKVWEYGCADVVDDKLVRIAAHFHGIDLSDKAIATARQVCASVALTDA